MNPRLPALLSHPAKTLLRGSTSARGEEVEADLVLRVPALTPHSRRAASGSPRPRSRRRRPAGRSGSRSGHVVEIPERLTPVREEALGAATLPGVGTDHRRAFPVPEDRSRRERRLGGTNAFTNRWTMRTASWLAGRSARSAKGHVRDPGRGAIAPATPSAEKPMARASPRSRRKAKRRRRARRSGWKATSISRPRRPARQVMAHVRGAIVRPFAPTDRRALDGTGATRPASPVGSATSTARR